MKLKQLAIILTICIGLPIVVRSQGNQTNSAQSGSGQTRIEAPSGVKNSTYDSQANKQSVLFIEVAADNKIYLRKPGMSEFKDGKIIDYFNYTLLTDANMVGEITTILQDKAPDRRLAYIQADRNVKFGKLADMFEKLAAGNVDLNKFQLVVNPLKEVEKSQETDRGGYVLTMIMPENTARSTNSGKISGGIGSGRGSSNDPSPPPPPGYKPKPKTAEQIAAEEKAKKLDREKAEARRKIKVEKLSVELDGAGKIKFNNRPQTSDEFTANLKKIFDERTYYDIFRAGTNEADNTIYLKISPTADYGAAVKLIDEIYGLGANRLYLDGLRNK